MSYKYLEHSTDAFIEVKAKNLEEAFSVAGKSVVESKIDDTIDQMDGIASRLHSYKITTTPPHALDIANELVKATKEVELMTAKLRNIKNPSTMIEHCRKTSAIEHKVDELYKLAMSELFEGTDAIQIIKLKDIYESLETASDKCVDVADVVEDIVLKYT